METNSGTDSKSAEAADLHQVNKNLTLGMYMQVMLGTGLSLWLSCIRRRSSVGKKPCTRMAFFSDELVAHASITPALRKEACVAGVNDTVLRNYIWQSVMNRVIKYCS